MQTAGISVTIMVNTRPLRKVAVVESSIEYVKEKSAANTCL
jgi:hypothetical protein